MKSMTASLTAIFVAFCLAVAVVGCDGADPQDIATTSDAGANTCHSTDAGVIVDTALVGTWVDSAGPTTLLFTADGSYYVDQQPQGTWSGCDGNVTIYTIEGLLLAEYTVSGDVLTLGRRTYSRVGS